MPSDPNTLGGRAPLLEPDQLDAQQRELYDKINQKQVPWAEKAGFTAKLIDGRLVGPFNPFLFSPELSDIFLEWEGVEQDKTSLTDRERQIVILATGAVWQSDYERYAHAAVARSAGLSEAAIEALRRGDPAPDLDKKEAVAQRFTSRLCGDRHIEEELYEEALAAFKYKGIADIVHLAGHYMTISSLLNVFSVPVPK